jgi:hypothetical protein
MLIWLAAAALTLASPPHAPRARACAPAAAATATVPTTLPTTLPVEVWSNHIYVKVCIADRDLDFILDTGAGGTSLDLSIAKQLGVRLGNTFTVGGAGAGRVAGAQVADASVTLAGSSIMQPIATAIDFSGLPPREGHRIDGILGYDFVARYVVAIDYARSELRIYDRDRFQYAGPGTSIPIVLINRFPHIDAAVTLADGEALRGRFVIDVGSGAGLALTKPFVDEHRLRERVGPTIHRTSSGGIGGSAPSDFCRVESLSLGAFTVARPIAQLYGDSAGVLSARGQWVGNIGGGILRRFTVFFDYQGKRMILEPNARLNDAFEADMSGLNLVTNDSLSSIVVANVTAGSPAAEAGLQNGDVVVSVDGAPASRELLGELRERRFRRPGEHIVFTVRRAGEVKQLELVTRRLI